MWEGPLKDTPAHDFPVQSPLMHPQRLDRARHVSTPQPIASTPSQCPSRDTIGRLSDKVLLNIFRYLLDVSPRHWPRLVHVCRKWRHIVFASQRSLHLRLYCTYGTPVLTTLDCWHALPIVIQYGGILELDPPAPEDEDNIVAALKQSDRVSSISLTVTNSLLEKLSAIERPFLGLEDLVLLSPDSSLRLTLPSAFGWSTRLRSLHLTRISFFALPQLLYSSRKLVDLQLHEVSNPWLFSPEALTDALSGMGQLQSLSLHFLPTTNHIGISLPSRKRVVLPELTRLNFRGITEYLEDLVAGIDAPRLGDIEVTFLNKSISGLSKLSEFIDRIETHKLHHRAHILSTEKAIFISLIQPGTSTCLKLQLLCEPLIDQLSFIAQICTRFSGFLVDVEDLHISATRPSKQEDNFAFDWHKAINSFIGVKRLHVSENLGLSTNIVRALSGKHKPVLPALHKLYIPQPGPRHAPLREAVVSAMTLRRLSGNPIEVEYELCHIGEQSGTGFFWKPVTIEMISDDILLNIFRHFLDDTPQIWPALMYVCKRWRQVIKTSPLGLNLRLYCKPGTPVLTVLGCWTAVPIVVQYGGSSKLDPPATEEDDNIIAALKQSDRVISISLTLTISLIEKVSAISEPFSELEELILLSRDGMRLTLPSTFRWGPRLRKLNSTRITIPLPQLLFPSTGLVQLRLCEIPSDGYFSPEALANALSGMSQLEELSLHFLSLPSGRNLPPPSGDRVVLPALVDLTYRGTSKYLDRLLARIDAPRLSVIKITFFSQPTMDATQLGRILEQMEPLIPLTKVTVKHSAHAISITFSHCNTNIKYEPLRLRITCEQFDWQLFSLTQICAQITPFISRVQYLDINTARSPSAIGQDGVGSEQWLGLVRSFGGTTELCVRGELRTDIMCALRPAAEGHTHTHTTVLPSLNTIRVRGPMTMHGPLWDAAQSLVVSRLLSGHPVRLIFPRLFVCHICHTDFGSDDLKKHLVDKHAYRIMCLHCDDFTYEPGRNHLFGAHLESKHPQVAQNEAHFSKFFMNVINSLVDRHSSPRPPGHRRTPIS